LKSVLVMMATFNGEKFLREQLDSIYAQDNVKVKVLVRDDGSTDATLNILDDYHSSNDLDYIAGEHLAVDFGFLELLRMADKHFDFYAFSDQDDVWNRDKLDTAVQSLEAFDKSVPALYYCGQELVDENLKHLETHRLNSERSLMSRFLLSDIAGCTAVFNVALVERVNQFCPEYSLMHDSWLLKVCLALGGHVFVDPDAHIKYRQHGNNTVGLQHSFIANVKQAWQYITKYSVEKQMRELFRGYGPEMVAPYAGLCQDVCNYRDNYRIKARLTNRNRINFHNNGLNATYYLKIILNRL
jgi:glycosyltransferase involved in cell wall biosynthesis